MSDPVGVRRGPAGLPVAAGIVTSASPQGPSSPCRGLTKARLYHLYRRSDSAPASSCLRVKAMPAYTADAAKRTTAIHAATKPMNQPLLVRGLFSCSSSARSLLSPRVEKTGRNAGVLIGLRTRRLLEKSANPMPCWVGVEGGCALAWGTLLAGGVVRQRYPHAWRG